MSASKIYLRRVTAAIGVLLAVVVLGAGPAYATTRGVGTCNDDNSCAAAVSATLEWVNADSDGNYEIATTGRVEDRVADGYAAVVQLKYSKAGTYEYPIIARASSAGTDDHFFYRLDAGVKNLYMRVCLFTIAVGPTNCSGWY